jgi:DNA-binding MarR family transcriptional regulator
MSKPHALHPDTQRLIRLFFPVRFLFEKLVQKNHAVPPGLTPQQVRLLMGLHAKGSGVRLSGLSEFLAVSQATMTLAVQKLIRRGLVRRGKDPLDERALSLTLSAKGRTLAEKTRGRMMEVLDEFYRRVPSRDRKKLIESLEFLFRTFQAALQEGGAPAGRTQRSA